MKKLVINTNNAGLVYKNSELKRVLQAGKHWLGLGETADVYNMAAAFSPARELDVLLQNSDLAAMLDVVEVGDNEIVLLYQNKNFVKVLTAGKYAFWKGITAWHFIRVDLNDAEIAPEIDRNLLEKAPLLAFVRAYRVEAHEKALMFTDGKFTKVLEAGNYSWWKNSMAIQLIKADMRQQNMELSGQEILTKDKAQLRINFSVQYKVTDLMKALLESREFEKQLYITVQLALREFIGRLSFDELMEGKEQISETVMALAKRKAETLGVELLAYGVKDIILPGDLKDIMNQVLIAEKRVQANIITRREETASTRSLLNTAKLMEENTMLYKLKEMEYVEKIAEKINTISVSGSGQIVEQLKQIFIKQ
jgi:regulator of protease activity HflC (stomatin/prohibitin superfamily)